MNDSKTAEEEEDGPRRRRRALAVLLVLLGILTVIATFANLTGSDYIAESLPNAPEWAASGIFAIGLIGILAVVSLVAIWNWYRWGAYLYATLMIATFGLNMLILGGGTPLFGLLGGATILFLVSRQWSDFE